MVRNCPVPATNNHTCVWHAYSTLLDSSSRFIDYIDYNFAVKNIFFIQTTKKNVRSEVKKDWGEKKLQCFFLANCTSKHEFVHVQMFFEYMFVIVVCG